MCSDSRWDKRLSRRRFLSDTTTLLSIAAFTTGFYDREQSNGLVPVRLTNASIPSPFTLGVASGEPTTRAVVIWTRLAPRPDRTGGGMPAHSVFVDWEVATDSRFANPIRTGTAVASPVWAHSVHVDVGGLKPGRDYWFRFSVAGHRSPIGRTQTLPTNPEAVTFAHVACQDYTAGYYNAYTWLAKEQVNFVLHVGDYIYDTNFGSIRNHLSDAEPQTLEEYRIRHALYKTDRELQGVHATFPFFYTLDNHDALPDYEKSDDQRARRAAAYQAWYEHQPIRRRGYSPGSSALQIYQTVDLGNLMRMNILDTRQFRDTQDVCQAEKNQSLGFGIYRPICSEVRRQNRSMLGTDQQLWLAENFSNSRACWNVMVSSVMFSPLKIKHANNFAVYESAWDYYPQARHEILDLTSSKRNLIVLSGDIHAHLTANVKASSDHLNGPTLGTEFLTTSITAQWPSELDTPIRKSFTANPHILLYHSQPGYTLHRLSREAWVTEQKVVETVARRDAGLSTLARWCVEDGKPGAVRYPAKTNEEERRRYAS